MNRWSDDFAAYHRYIDHDAHDVAYLCTPEGAKALEATRIAHIEIVPDFNDPDRLRAALDACRARLDGVDRLIALSEFDLLAAAQLREAFDIPGDRPATAARFRDKTVMKRVVGAAGMRVPRFVELDGPDDAHAAVAGLRYPLVVKPRTGAASVGVHRVDSATQFDALLPRLTGSAYECEEFVEGPIYHVDGIVSGGQPLLIRASRYLNTCLDFANGKPLGSIMLQPGPSNDELLAFAQTSLRALSLTDGAFHLEVIRGGDGLYFLEIGARVGGGEIPFLFRDLYGIDLFSLWVRQQLDDGTPLASQAGVAAAARSAELGGFLMLPEAAGSRLVRAVVPDGIAPLYAAITPKANHVFDGKGGYDDILGRFRYRGRSEDEIEAAIDATLERFRYELGDIDAPSRPAWPRGQRHHGYFSPSPEK
ncbi:ATP-grasp domain-containing protein [Paraburkholderia ribeironis]|nr:ATP-grasp domain-containing protein [Paraburkholderia ribeironis]